MSPGTSSSAGTSDDLSVTTHARRHDEHLPERLDALGRLALLVQAHHRVDDREADDDEARAELLQGNDADTSAAPSSTSCMRSRYCRRNAFQLGSFASSASLLAPYFARRAFTSAVLSPTFGSTESRSQVSSIERVCHSTGPWSGALRASRVDRHRRRHRSPFCQRAPYATPDATTFRRAMHEWRPDQSGIGGRLRGCVSGRSTWGSC